MRRWWWWRFFGFHFFPYIWTRRTELTFSFTVSDVDAWWDDTYNVSYMNAVESGAAFLFCQIITIQDSSNLFVDFVFNLEFISMNVERKIFSPFDVVIACWSVYKSYLHVQVYNSSDVLHSTWTDWLVDCWSSHYQKVILRTKTLISHLAESVDIAVTITSYIPIQE